MSSLVNRRAAAGLTAAICTLALLDGVNGALGSVIRPYLMGSVAGGPDEIAWAAIAYFSAKLTAFLLSQRSSDVFGERHLLLGAAALLVIVTALSGFAESTPFLVSVQLLQGAAGGIVLAVGQGVLLKRCGRGAQPIIQAFLAFAVLVFPVMIVPFVLGATAYAMHWSYVSFVCASLGGIAWLALHAVRDHLDEHVIRNELPAGRALLLAGSLAGVVYVLLEGVRHAWSESSIIVLTLVCAGAGLGIFGWLEIHRDDRLLEYRPFRLADFTFGVCVSLLAGVALLGSGTMITMLANGLLGYTAPQSGLVQQWSAPFAVLALGAVGFCLRQPRIPPPLFLATGVVLFALGMWSLGGITSGMAADDLFASICLRGFGLGCLFLTLTMISLGSVPAEHATAAAGFFNFGRHFGGLLGISWMQTLHEHLMSRGHEALAAAWTPANPEFTQALAQAKGVLIAQGATLAQASTQAMALLTAEFQRETSALAFNGCFQALAMLFVFAVPIVVIVRVTTELCLLHGE
ncbi:MFS transporter [Steroidobacter agaridevorans]|uniref:MFS transporter n=1 Tax=Steroidobacter agaridevorans TaxID=2695856 RepID=A0A829YHT2_9GAMM|nr:MFS transporter [Steroidobacter agaridevorans]GFE82106.1 MFS transporter [Steroidobacter agaridevorans]GFE85506.1 MFS transporter [Steroidobacter agaridevorans]